MHVNILLLFFRSSVAITDQFVITSVISDLVYTSKKIMRDQFLQLFYMNKVGKDFVFSLFLERQRAKPLNISHVKENVVLNT